MCYSSHTKVILLSVDKDTLKKKMRMGSIPCLPNNDYLWRMAKMFIDESSVTTQVWQNFKLTQQT